MFLNKGISEKSIFNSKNSFNILAENHCIRSVGKDMFYLKNMKDYRLEIRKERVLMALSENWGVMPTPTSRGSLGTSGNMEVEAMWTFPTLTLKPSMVPLESIWDSFTAGFGQLNRLSPYVDLPNIGDILLPHLKGSFH